MSGCLYSCSLRTFLAVCKNAVRHATRWQRTIIICYFILVYQFSGTNDQADYMKAAKKLYMTKETSTRE
jgi:hypothetical protein